MKKFKNLKLYLLSYNLLENLISSGYYDFEENEDILVNRAIKEGTLLSLYCKYKNELSIESKKIIISNIDKFDLSFILSDEIPIDLQDEFVNKVINYNLQKEFIVLCNEYVKQTLSKENFKKVVDNIEFTYGLYELIEFNNFDECLIIELFNKRKIICVDETLSNAINNMFTNGALNKIDIDYLIKNDYYNSLNELLHKGILNTMDKSKVLNKLICSENFEIIKNIDLSKIDLLYIKPIIKIVVETKKSNIECLIDYANSFDNVKINDLILEQLLEYQNISNIIEFEKNTKLDNNALYKIFLYLLNNSSSKEIYNNLLYLREINQLPDDIYNDIINLGGDKLFLKGEINYIFCFLKQFPDAKEEIKEKLKSKLFKSKNVKYITLYLLYVEPLLIEEYFLSVENFYKYIIFNNIFSKGDLINARKILYPNLKKENERIEEVFLNKIKILKYKENNKEGNNENV